MRLHVENCGPQPVAVKGVGAEDLQYILGAGETWEPVAPAYVRPVNEGWEWHALPTDIDGHVEFRTPLPVGALLAEVSVCPHELWLAKQ